ncbi:MAG: MBL fold metallo-hydrolase RNA specificity domain-containing protein [Planctomycetota bacterium]
MFHWDDGLKLTRADLAIDFRRRQPRAFVSHAHSDHIARHEYALCTPATAALYQHRLGRRRTLDLPYRQPVEWAGVRLTTLPAGHCLGSAMLLAEEDGCRLLYTGDFKLGESATAEVAELCQAEILIIESTYGTPQYRLPKRAQVLEEFFTLVHAAIAEERTPIIHAYSLGKAQEVTRLLTAEGIPVLQHRSVFEISRIYEQFGVPLGQFALLQDDVLPGWAVVVPPNASRVDSAKRPVRFMVSGWAIDPRAKYRFHVDHAIPLSDHADFDDLLETIRRVAPRKVYCTHGPLEFVDHVRAEGFDAAPLGPSHGVQLRLFT